MRKRHQFITYIFICIIFIFLCGYLYEYKLDKGQRNLLNEELKIYQENGYMIGKKVNIDYSKQYPFANDTKSNIKKTKLDQVFDKLESIINKIDDLSNDYILFKDEWIYLYGKFQGMINSNIILQEAIVYKMDNDYLTYINDPIDISKNADNLEALRDYVMEKNEQFLYVQLPYKLDEDKLVGIDYINDNAKNLLQALNFNEVLDLRESFEPKEHYFYQTDHHFSPLAGLKSAKYMLEALNVEYDETKLDENAFEEEAFEDSFLGSQGKKMGLGYVKADDFSFLYPTYQTAFNVVIPSESIDASNEFKKAFINPYNIVYRNDFYGTTNIYGSYMYGNPAYAGIKNNLIDNNTKILLIHDSFSAVIAPYMALAVKELDAIDLRYFNGSLKDYLDKNEYDAVVVAYNSSAIVEASDKHNNFFNFE